MTISLGSLIELIVTPVQILELTMLRAGLLDEYLLVFFEYLCWYYLFAFWADALGFFYSFLGASSCEKPVLLIQVFCTLNPSLVNS